MDCSEGLQRPSLFQWLGLSISQVQNGGKGNEHGHSMTITARHGSFTFSTPSIVP
jgi:hypothetical protein